MRCGVLAESVGGRGGEDAQWFRVLDGFARTRFSRNAYMPVHPSSKESDILSSLCGYHISTHDVCIHTDKHSHTHEIKINGIFFFF